MGTREALYCRMFGGVMPAGNARVSVWEVAVSWAMPDSIRAPGWKKILITDEPATDWDSMCSMSLTVLVNTRSVMRAMRALISSAGRPERVQTTAAMGIRTSGKMSVGIRLAVTTPRTTMSKPTTTNVYGRLSATRTIHITHYALYCMTSSGSCAGRVGGAMNSGPTGSATDSEQFH